MSSKGGTAPHYVISGGSGLIGTALVRHWQAAGARCTVLTRGGSPVPAGAAAVRWGRDVEPAAWAPVLEGCTAVIHLAGAGVADGRWTRRRMRLLWDSRVEPSRQLAVALATCRDKPAVYVQASGVGIYGQDPDAPPAVAGTTPPGDDFLGRLAVAWEAASDAVVEAGLRRVLLRTSAVLTPAGGVLARMLPAFRRGCGPILGSGRQIVPWIHLEDEVRAIDHLVHAPDARGPFDLVAPQRVEQRDFARALAAALGRRCRLRVPAWLLRLGLGRMSDLLLGGRAVLPTRLLASGFGFRHPRLGPALEDLLGSQRAEAAA